MTTKTEDITAFEAGEMLDGWRKDPARFIREVLGGDPWEKQVEIMEAVRDNPRVAVRSCSSSGKSWTAACVVLWFLLTHNPATVITTAPTQRQVRDILWREVHARYYGAKIPLGGKLLTTELQYDEVSKWFAVGLTTTEKERFLGYHNTNVLVVADEASGIPEEIWEAIENPLSSGNTHLLMIGNPTQHEGSFFKAFQPNSGYHTIHISYKDTPNFRDDLTDVPFLINPEWVASRRVEWTEDSPLWQIYIMGEFAAEELGRLIPTVWIDTARNADMAPTGGVVIGVDTAREGEDENVAIVRQGNKVLALESWHEADTMKTADRVAAIADLWFPVRINIDQAPIGVGVLDRLREREYPAVGINVGMSPYHPKQFVNIRAEMFWNLRQLFQNQQIDILDDPELINQLSYLKYDVKPGEQRIMIERKKDMKSRGLKSPDRADALALAFYEYTGKGSVETKKLKMRYW